MTSLIFHHFSDFVVDLTSRLTHQTEATVSDIKSFEEVVSNVWKS